MSGEGHETRNCACIDLPKGAISRLQNLPCSRSGYRCGRRVPQAAKEGKPGLPGCRSGPLPDRQEFRARRCRSSSRQAAHRSPRRGAVPNRVVSGDQGAAERDS
jgi:hypothetical protein